MSDHDEEVQRQLQARYPNSPPPRPAPAEPPKDPLLVQRYPSMASPTEREAAARELAPEITAPPEVDAASPEFQAFKIAAKETGLDNAGASRLLTKYAEALTGARKR